MRVLCLFVGPCCDRIPSLAEACITLSPQVAAGSCAVFVEIGASRALFSEQECIHRARKVLELLDLKASIGLANDPATALSFARFQIRGKDALPLEALAHYLSPFSPEPLGELEVFRKLGILTIGDFLKVPRRELPSRFGKAGLLAFEKLLRAGEVAWPRFHPPEKILERVDFECAAQIETFEPVLFLLKSAFERVFLRLHARRQKLAAFTVRFHLNKFSASRERASSILLPLPQSEPKSVLSLARERLMKELENQPLEDSLEGISVEVSDTAPLRDTQRDFFTKVEEEREAWASLVGRLQERLGAGAAFLAHPTPRLLPEASWGKALLEEESGTLVDVPLRPLRLLDPPLRLQRVGDWLLSHQRRWRFTGFTGVEKLKGEWWLGGFERDYFRVETEEGEDLWVYTASVGEGGPKGLWLHGVFD
jgi:protein ImuB